MKQAIVTGAYGAIGKAISRGLADEGYAVTLVGRDRGRLEKTVLDLSAQTGNMFLKAAVVDLGEMKDIAAFAASWSGPLHLLVNNAATAPRKRMETGEGVEMQFAVNVLGYFRMIRAFSPMMPAGSDARIVNVASYWAGGLDLSDPEFRKRRYDNDDAYRQSKQADRMLTATFAVRLKAKDIAVNACHPGDVNSKLSNDLGFGGHATPEQGAFTPLHASLSPGLKGVTGAWFEQGRESRCHFMADAGGVERLFSLCETYETN